MMSDLISRLAAINKILGQPPEPHYPSWYAEQIKELPSAQPEIIRCKDCKYNATSKKCLNPNSFFLVPADDDFCSYAERREVTE